MKQRIFTSMIFIICCLSTYAQDSIFTAKAYYSAPNEITVEIENLTNQEITIFVNKGSDIYLYKEAGEYKSKKLTEHLLTTTDSLDALVKIPQNKIHLSKYKVEDRNLSKAYLDIRYTLKFISPPANTEWTVFSKEMNISPYNSKRKNIDKNRIFDKKERINGEEVYSNPEVMPEFPGGEAELLYFLNRESWRHHSEFQSVVTIKIIIEKDGSISHPYLLSGTDRYSQKEALAIIKRMPKWKPGLNNGKPVRSFRHIMIIFKYT